LTVIGGEEHILEALHRQIGFATLAACEVLYMSHL